MFDFPRAEGARCRFLGTAAYLSIKRNFGPRTFDMHVVVHSHQSDVTGRVSLAELVDYVAFWVGERMPAKVRDARIVVGFREASCGGIVLVTVEERQPVDTDD